MSIRTDLKSDDQIDNFKCKIYFWLCLETDVEVFFLLQIDFFF